MAASQLNDDTRISCSPQDTDFPLFKQQSEQRDRVRERGKEGGKINQITWHKMRIKRFNRKIHLKGKMIELCASARVSVFNASLPLPHSLPSLSLSLCVCIAVHCWSAYGIGFIVLSGLPLTKLSAAPLAVACLTCLLLPPPAAKPNSCVHILNLITTRRTTNDTKSK